MENTHAPNKRISRLRYENNKKGKEKIFFLEKDKKNSKKIIFNLEFHSPDSQLFSRGKRNVEPFLKIAVIELFLLTYCENKKSAQ